MANNYGNYGNGNGNGQNSAPRNVCTNFQLKCFEVKESDKGVTLRCTLGSRKKEDGTYSKGIRVSVWCGFNSCSLAREDYKNAYISVNGTLNVQEYVSRNGTVGQNITIFATSVTKRHFANNGNGRNNGYRQNNNNGGYGQQGGYNNGGYQQNNGGYGQQGGYQQNNGYQQNGYNNGGYQQQPNNGYGQQGGWNGDPNDGVSF